MAKGHLISHSLFSTFPKKPLLKAVQFWMRLWRGKGHAAENITGLYMSPCSFPPTHTFFWEYSGLDKGVITSRISDSFMDIGIQFVKIENFTRDTAFVGYVKKSESRSWAPSYLTDGWYYLIT